MFSGKRKKGNLGGRDVDGHILTLTLRNRIHFVHRIDLAQERENWSLLLDMVIKLLVL
jgi:hypothetical protein